MGYKDYTKRAVAIIIQTGEILLMHRIKDGSEYYVFPGGGVEEGETPDQAVIRELREEFQIDIRVDKELFQISNTLNNRTRQEYYFYVTNFAGTPTLGGEEKERMSEQNQYDPEWVELAKLKDMPLFPEYSKQKIIQLFCN